MRERILYAASVLFSRRGYTGTSIRDIGRAVGIRGPSLYHHFASKDAIFSELLTYSMGVPRAFAEQLASEQGDPAVRLHRYVCFDYEHLANSVYDLHGVHNVFVMERVQFAPWLDQLHRVRAAVAAIVRQGSESGRFITIDVTVVGETISGLVTRSLSEMREDATLSRERALAAADLIVRALLSDVDDLLAVREQAGSFHEADQAFEAAALATLEEQDGTTTLGAATTTGVVMAASHAAVPDTAAGTQRSPEIREHTLEQLWAQHEELGRQLVALLGRQDHLA